MAKLLIGCYPFSSSSNYGASHTNVKAWLLTAVKALDDERKAKLTQLEQGNAFQAIFVAPEYQFTDPTSPTVRHAMSAVAKDNVLTELVGLSNAYKEILMFPGTVFWKERLNTDEGLKKFQANLVAAHLDKRNSGQETSVVESTRTLGGATVPSLIDVSQSVKTASTSYRAYNELYSFLGGNQGSPYLKSWDFKETEGATATDQAYIPGSSSGKKDIGGFEFGLEVCFDHANHKLKDTGEEVDFHIVASDWVESKTAHMAMKDAGYFIHASSNVSETCVYVRNGSTYTKLTPTPPVQSNQLSTWLVDVRKQARATVTLSVAQPPQLTATGKKVPAGAVKLMF